MNLQLNTIKAKAQIVLPHTVKVALYVFVSAGLTALLNNVANLHLDEVEQGLVIMIINAILAGLSKWNATA